MLSSVRDLVYVECRRCVDCTLCCVLGELRSATGVTCCDMRDRERAAVTGDGEIRLGFQTTLDGSRDSGLSSQCYTFTEMSFSVIKPGAGIHQNW